MSEGVNFQVEDDAETKSEEEARAERIREAIRASNARPREGSIFDFSSGGEKSEGQERSFFNISLEKDKESEDSVLGVIKKKEEEKAAAEEEEETKAEAVEEDAETGQEEAPEADAEAEQEGAPEGQEDQEDQDEAPEASAEDEDDLSGAENLTEEEVEGELAEDETPFAMKQLAEAKLEELKRADAEKETQAEPEPEPEPEQEPEAEVEVPKVEPEAETTDPEADAEQESKIDVAEAAAEHFLRRTAETGDAEASAAEAIELLGGEPEPDQADEKSDETSKEDVEEEQPAAEAEPEPAPEDSEEEPAQPEVEAEKVPDKDEIEEEPEEPEEAEAAPEADQETAEKEPDQEEDEALPPPPVPPVDQNQGPGGPEGHDGNRQAGNLPPDPNQLAAEKAADKTHAPEYYDSANPAVAALIGGIIGYFIGRRRGRIKTEKKLLPIQKKLEKQVTNLHWELQEKEDKIRRIAAERVKTHGQQLTETFSKLAKEQKAKEAKLHMLRAPEHLGQVLMSAESGRMFNRQERNRVERAGNLDRKEVGREQAPKQLDKRVETMSREELLNLSEKIEIDGSNLRHIYETHLIGERGLRRLISEHIQGGDLRKALRKEVVEREIDFERDPVLRDLTPQELSQPPTTASRATLETLLKKAELSVNDNSEEAAFFKARAAYEAEQNKQQLKRRRTVDFVMAGVISGLILLVLILFLTR